MRPHWDDVWLECARAVAKRSLCVRAQVGVVIVDSENRIVATGYNGPPAAFDHRDEPCNMWCDRGAGGEAGTNCPASHAEQNAFMAADRSSWQHGTLYVTGHVCAECTKLISNSGLARVVIQPDDVDRSYRSYDDSYRFMRSMRIGIEVLEPYVTE